MVSQTFSGGFCDVVIAIRFRECEVLDIVIIHKFEACP